MNVLIVEDEWIVSEELKEVFLSRGAKQVWQAADGSTASNVIKSIQLGVVILDIVLEGTIDGLEIANKLLTLREDCSNIFLSSYYDQKAREKLSLIKPMAILHKPCTTMELMGILHQNQLLA